jgi:hypothetical protein
MRKPTCPEEAKTIIATVVTLSGITLLILIALIHSLIPQEIFLKFNSLFNVFYFLSISFFVIGVFSFIMMASNFDGSNIDFDWLFDKEKK